MANKTDFIILSGFLITLISIILIMSIPSFGTSWGTNNSVFEDAGLYSYNLTANTTYESSDTPLNFSIQSIESSLYAQTAPSFYYWINISSTTGVLTINTTLDNQTGRFNISIQVLDKISQYGELRPFYFIVNASNDYPNITYINNSYNMTANVSFVRYVNASDEENHWPLLFNLTFYNNCTKRPWSNRTDCNIFSIVNATNASGIMNFTPSKYDAGVYWANISVRDYGAHYNCSAYPYCLANYSQNRTYYYPQVIQFNIYTYLEVNASDCKNKIFQENQSGTCWINITSREYGDNITYISNATLRSYPGYVTNASWFFSNWSNYTNNYTASILINITAGKSAIGNWTINFSASDVNFSEYNYDLINITVNRTLNDIPRLAAISNLDTSTGALFRVNITAYDDDHLIPDKFAFNESINFTVNITNQSNSAQSFNFSAFNFTVEILNYSILGTNRTVGKIELNPNSTMVGDFYVNITATDADGANVSTGFNLTVRNNFGPVWNETLSRVFSVYEHNITYLNLSKNVTDPNSEDSINFSYTLDGYFPSFNLNSTTGIINFTANDSDVGFHTVTISATDGYIVNSTTFNFTILNVNETPVLRRPVTITGGTGNSAVGMNATEDSSVSITFYVEDPDLGIITPQKAYYNENLTIVNLTISVGPNSSLFSINTITPAVNNTNYSSFTTSFTPKKADVGTYTIFLNVSDKSSFSDSISFNITIDSTDHAPVINNLTNQTTAVNRTLNYMINVTDVEDGSSLTFGNSNFTFSYAFLSGRDFINNNQSIFNTTSGVLNYTFNSSEGGRYKVNMTVNDTSGLSLSSVFWIFVYDVPNITFPPTNYQFSNIFENSSYSFNFTINQSMQDNVTCEIYIGTLNGNILRNNISGYGNNTNFSWNLITNYTDETYGAKNLTLVVYPATNSISDAYNLNITKVWNITINHTNNLLSFASNIGGSTRNISGGSPQQIVLSDYFNDIDANDIYHNQTITFTYSTNSIIGTITVNLTNWVNSTTPIMSFSAASSSRANYTVTAIEWNESNSSQQISNVTSNTFTVDLTVSTTTVSSPSSGGGGSSASTIVPYALKIIVPSKISGYANERIIVPLKLVNNGKETFNNINLSALGLKNGTNEKTMKVSFDKSYVSSLAPGKSVDLTMTLLFLTNKTGDYEVTVSATSKNPSYTDWSKIYINLQKINETDVRKYVLFTEEYIVQNPSCLELKEQLNEADRAMERGDFSNARAIAENVLNTCKSHVEQASIPLNNLGFSNRILEYFVIAIIVSILAGIGYYYIRRRDYRKNSVKVKSVPINKKAEGEVI